jgi:hypothetical protein
LFSSFVIGNWLLTGPAGLKTLPYGAVERLHACKHKSILTYFQTKVKHQIFAAASGSNRKQA